MGAATWYNQPLHVMPADANYLVNLQEQEKLRNITEAGFSYNKPSQSWRKKKSAKTS